MDRHRIRGEVGLGSIPRPVAPAFAPGSFALCCVPCACPLYGLWQQELYRWAFAEAQAVVRPSLPERDLLAVWN
jgi:hypothetical protein